MLLTWMDDLRQRMRYSKEFRIASPRWLDLARVVPVDDLVTLMKTGFLQNRLGDSSDEGRMALIAEMGTACWRLKKRLDGGEAPSPELKRLARDVESMGDSLAQAGVQIKDHTGDSYDGHMRLRVIEFILKPGLQREIIVETIKPTIYRNDTLIQMGEVIVGMPETSPSGSAAGFAPTQSN